MVVKVCGMREPENIRAVEQLGVDMLGFIFWPGSPRYVGQMCTKAGSLADDLSENGRYEAKKAARVGVFVDDNPQNIVAHVRNYHLQYVQLHGSESPMMIDSLRHLLAPGIRIIKALSIGSPADMELYKVYEGHVDMFLFDTKCQSVGGSGKQFDWSVLNAYDGSTPFLLSGGIGPDDAERVKAFRHSRLAGIDLNSRFETRPAVKDVNALRRFLDEVR